MWPEDSTIQTPLETFFTKKYNLLFLNIPQCFWITVYQINTSFTFFLIPYIFITDMKSVTHWLLRSLCVVSACTIRVRTACVCRSQNIKGLSSRAFDCLLPYYKLMFLMCFGSQRDVFNWVCWYFTRLGRFCPLINPGTWQHRSCAHHPWLLLRSCFDWVNFIYFSGHQKKSPGDEVWVSSQFKLFCPVLPCASYAK